MGGAVDIVVIQADKIFVEGLIEERAFPNAVSFFFQVIGGREKPATVKLLLIVSQWNAQSGGVKASIHLIDEVVIYRQIEVDPAKPAEQQIVQRRISVSRNVIDA